MLFERVTHILLFPKYTWHEIKEEPIGFGHVLTEYAVPLAAIPAIFGLFGYTIIGIRSGFGQIVYRIPFHIALLWAIVYYILTLVGLYIEGIVINALASSFESEHNAVHAFKLAVYAYTPVFLAGVLRIIPVLATIVFLFSLYGIYLLYVGLPVMMGTPKDKVAGYLICSVVAMFIIYLINWGISAAIL